MEGPAVDPEADFVVPRGDADADVVGVGGEDGRRPSVEVGQEEEVGSLEDQEGASRSGRVPRDSASTSPTLPTASMEAT